MAWNSTENRDHKPDGQEHIVDRAIVSPKHNTKEHFMSSTTDKIKGTTNEAIGKAKQGVGEAVGSDRLQGEGAIQEAKGHGQKAVGDVKQAAKDAANKAAALANKKL
jgi:uncharacterized protein YjbJ (UPF0337 family)